MARSRPCTFADDRGDQLSGRLEEPDGPVHATAVLAHGFTPEQDVGAARRIARCLAARGIAVLAFDATASGSEVDDVVAAAGYLADTIAPPALLVGHAVGGAAVLMAADRLDGVAAVATLAAPADVDDVTEVVGRLDAALLLLHGPLDDRVPVDDARVLFQAARTSKSFVSLDDADHLLTDAADAHYAGEVIAAWATRYLPAEAATPTPMPRGTGDYADDTVVARTAEGLRAQMATRGFLLQADEPAAHGGTETGPTPYDYLAAALAACTSMTVRMYADRKQLPLEEVATAVAFDRVHAEDCADCEHTDGRIERFTRTLTLQGDLDEETRRKLFSIANRCPVHRTLEGQIEIRSRLVD